VYILQIKLFCSVHTYVNWIQISTAAESFLFTLMSRFALLSTQPLPQLLPGALYPWW